MIASSALPARISSSATSFSGRSTNTQAPSGIPCSCAASRSPFPMTSWVRAQSGDPRKTLRLPDLRQRAIDSTVTSGFNSEMIPITPIGTRTRETTRPSGRSHRPVTAPTGSGWSAMTRSRSAISLTSSATIRTRATAALSLSLLSSVPNDFPSASTSISLAARIASSSRVSRSAIARKARSLTGPGISPRRDT